MPIEYTKNLYRGALTFLVIISLFFAMKFLAELRSYNMGGSGEANTITVSGHGEVQATPDIASVYFTIRKEAKTVKDAQDAVAKVEKPVLDLLKSSGVAEKDIRTESASFNPKYDYSSKASFCSPSYCPPSGATTVVGYEAYESISVKIRKTDDAGKIIAGLGSLGVTDLSGPNFSIDDEDALKTEARRKAIDEAREKAEVLANDLGVHLGSIATFSEGGGGYPIYYAKAEMARDSGGVANPAPAQLPKGENTISSDVTITYEIR